LPWPGSDQIYDAKWIHSDAAAAAKFILDVTANGQWQELGNQAQTEISNRYGLTEVNAAWTKLLTEDLPSANS